MTEPVDADALESLVRGVEQLRAERDYDHALIEELQGVVAGLSDRKRRRPCGVYPVWQAWVAKWLTPQVSRHRHRMRCCHQHAEHPEVAGRLEALWHSDHPAFS